MLLKIHLVSVYQRSDLFRSKNALVMDDWAAYCLPWIARWRAGGRRLASISTQ